MELSYNMGDWLGGWPASVFLIITSLLALVLFVRDVRSWRCPPGFSLL